MEATEIKQCLHFSNGIYKDNTDSCYCRKYKVTPGTAFHKCLTPDQGSRKHRILPE